MTASGLEETIRQALKSWPGGPTSQAEIPIAAAVLDYAQAEANKLRPSLARGDDPYNDGRVDGLEQLVVALGGGDV